MDSDTETDQRRPLLAQRDLDDERERIQSEKEQDRQSQLRNSTGPQYRTVMGIPLSNSEPENKKEEEKPKQYWNDYWLLFALGTLCIPPLMICGVHGRNSKDWRERIGGWINCLGLMGYLGFMSVIIVLSSL